MKKILFVCSVNTCRSVMAQQLAEHLYPEYEFSSAGVRADEGMPMMKGAYDALAAAGINPSSHYAVQLTTDMGNDADLIVCVNGNHKKYIEAYFPYINTPVRVMKYNPGDPCGMMPDVYAKSLKAIRDSITDILVNVKPADSSMLDTLCEAENICFSHPWDRNSMAYPLEGGIYDFLVAEYDGKLAGYGCVMTAADECTVMNIAVLPEYRGKGIGALLLDRLAECGRAKGAAVFFLEVRQSNAKAISLYKKYGFGEIGVRKNYYSDPDEDAIIMKKEENL